MSASHRRADKLDVAERELRDDRAVERWLLWKALVALLLVVLVAYVRFRYLT